VAAWLFCSEQSAIEPRVAGLREAVSQLLYGTLGEPG
jgi:hypothetical protein